MPTDVIEQAVADAADDGDVEATSVSQALSVPSRAGIYRRLRTEGRPVSAREASEMFGLHPNVARNHLDVLADAGLVMTGRRKQPAGGRPAKVYVAREESEGPSPTVPPGSALAVGILTQFVRDLPEGDDRLERLAERHGRRLVAATAGRAGRRDFEAALVVAVEALRRSFPEVRVVTDPETDDRAAQVAGLEVGLRLVGEADGEVGDALARGLLRGAVSAAGSPARVSSLEGRLWVAPDEDRRSEAPEPVTTVDARGKTYQAGVVLAMREIMSVAPGEHLEVLTDVQGAPAAFARWADRAGHGIVDVARVRDLKGREAVRLLLRRAPQRPGDVEEQR